MPCKLCNKNSNTLYNWCFECQHVVTLKCAEHWDMIRSICPSCLKLLEKCNKYGAIYYKQDFRRCCVIIKPNIFYWRLRYWINKYILIILDWILKPVIKWQYSFWNLKEGEDFISGIVLNCMGMIIENPKGIIEIKVPHWVNKEKVISYFKEIFKEIKCLKKL